MPTAYTQPCICISGSCLAPGTYTAGKQAAYQFSARLPAHEEQQAAIYRTRRFPLLAFRRVLWYYLHMKLYLLSCQNIEQYAHRILPLLTEQRRLSYARSHSSLALGAGLLLAALLDVHGDDDLTIGEYGKPCLSAGKPEFSLSHSGKHVLLGVSDRPIGVDMEPQSRIVTRPVIERMCLPQERNMNPLQVFTRKECAMKLTGLGFSLPLSDIDTTCDFCWEDGVYRFSTTAREGYVISVLSAEDGQPEIQLLTPEELL